MAKPDETFETDVLIIGAGATGTGVMRDLALRGVNCLLIDRQDLNAGASGGNHGLLHSGGRYASTDSETAAECAREAAILKRVMPHCIENCGGLFAAVEGDDVDFADRFPDQCAAAGIDCERLEPGEARECEPALASSVFAAFAVPDATIDPFRITLENVSHAQQLSDSQMLSHTRIDCFEMNGGVISAALCTHVPSGITRRIVARQYVNAAGAWAKEVALLAGCLDVDLHLSKGTLIISNVRITQRVVNRLRPAGDGDILVPGGTVSLLGTTSDTVTDPSDVRPTVAEVERNLQQGMALIPSLARTRFIRAFAGVRPLLSPTDTSADGRTASRGYRLFDHQGQAAVNLVTIVGGKLTTFRLMAEKTADLVATRLGVDVPCRTASELLPAAKAVRWTEPGFAPRDWFRRNDPNDSILCECEMVPASAIDAIVQSAPGIEQEVSMRAIGVRSRVGKGSCQGSFCGMRVNSYLYDRGHYDSRQGLQHLRSYVSGRFNGVRPVLWGQQMPQMELAEALHCGLMGLDLLDESAEPNP